jgi:hypothetical protein
MFDLFVVSMSLVALGPIDMPVSILRLMRAFRIIRMFGRIKTLRNIVTALTASILPVLNAFVILLVVASICGFPATTLCR